MQYQPVTEEIRRAIIEAIGDMSDGINSRFAGKIGVDGSTIGLWINKKRENIREDVWQRLEPLLRPYLARENEGEYKSEISNKQIPASELPFVKRFQRMAPKRPLEAVIMDKLPEISLEGLEAVYDFVRDRIKSEKQTAENPQGEGK